MGRRKAVLILCHVGCRIVDDDSRSNKQSTGIRMVWKIYGHMQSFPLIRGAWTGTGPYVMSHISPIPLRHC